MSLVVGTCLIVGVTDALAQKISYSPPDRSVIYSSDMQLVVTADGKLNQNAITIQVNQQKKELSVVDNLAYLQLTLQDGTNKLVVSRDGEAAQELTYIYQSPDKPVPPGFAVFYFHEAFVDGACGDCHEMDVEPFDINNLIISEEAISLCLECHDDRIQAKYIHGPVGMGVCTPCHDPHGTTEESLLKATGNSLCFSCHELERIQPHLDKLRGEGTTSDLCLSCHDSHGTDKKYHLK